MTTSTAGTSRARTSIAALALLVLSPLVAVAQPLLLAPEPADVLTPNKRQNTPYLKIAARLGLNWAAYSNDRYLDNTPLDVGLTSGENDIYSNAAGFGFGGGAEIEYPINTGLSLVGSLEYARARFGREGIVEQECADSAGPRRTANARHEWMANLDYLKLGGVVKLTFPSFYLLGGLTTGILVSSDIDRTREFESDGCSFLEAPRQRSIVENDRELPDPAALHWSLRFGFGLVYPIAEGLQFSPELTLDFGSGAINKSPEADLDFYTVSAVLRYELR